MPISLPRALTPLRQPRFRLLMAGQITSNVGDACYEVALPWYVLATHGGVVLLGAVLAAYGIPRTVLIAVGGYASDRWRPHTVMLATDITRAVALAGLALAATAGPARAAVLIPLAILIGAGEGLFLPASFSIVPSLLTGDDLLAGNALSASSTQLATIVGPALGGALVAVGGTEFAFALDAATFAVSALTLWRLSTRPATNPAPAALAPPTGAGTSTPAPTLRTLLRTERVLSIMLLVSVAANLGAGGLDVALPALVHGPLRAGATGYGVILAAFGGGALLGTLMVGQLRHPRRPMVAGAVAFLAMALCIALTPYGGSVAGVAAVTAGFGITNGFGNVLTTTAFQRWAPPGTLGRLSGLRLLTSFGLFPLSVAFGAIIVRDFGPAPFFLFTAAILAAAILVGLTQRAYRDLGAAQQGAPVRLAGQLPQPEG